MSAMGIPDAANCDGIAFAIDRDCEMWMFEFDTGISLGNYRNNVRNVTERLGPLRWMVPIAEVERLRTELAEARMLTLRDGA